MPRTPKSLAIIRLQKSLEAIPELKLLKSGCPQFTKWRRNTQVAIINTFGSNSDHINEFNKIRYSLSVFVSGTPDSAFQRAYERGLQTAESVLASMIEEIEEYWDDEDEVPVLSQSDKNEHVDTDEVFIIHGRDDGAKQAVARFLEKLTLKPVILHEQPNLGRTIIEKFEGHAQVGFAVALLTPDDVGSLIGEERNLNPRARQNVIFEFGFFVGFLGRARVCALTKEHVEIPSDYDGVVYIKLDADGAWKISLVRELKAAGFDVDANLAF